MIIASVRKLGSVGSTSESLPNKAIFIISSPLDLRRGILVGIAVACGFSVRAAGRITFGNVLVAAIVGAIVSVIVAVGMSVGVKVALGTVVLVGIMVGV